LKLASKKKWKIEDSQIRELISIRDERKLNQMTLYKRIGQLIGRSIKHLRNLNKNEASKVIENYRNNQESQINQQKIISKFSPQISKDEIRPSHEQPDETSNEVKSESPENVESAENESQRDIHLVKPEVKSEIETPKKLTWQEIVERQRLEKLAKENQKNA